MIASLKLPFGPWENTEAGERGTALYFFGGGPPGPLVRGEYIPVIFQVVVVIFC